MKGKMPASPSSSKQFSRKILKKAFSVEMKNNSILSYSKIKKSHKARHRGMSQICGTVRRKMLKWLRRAIIQGTIPKSVWGCTRRKLRTCRRAIFLWPRSTSKTQRRGIFGWCMERKKGILWPRTALITSPILQIIDFSAFAPSNYFFFCFFTSYEFDIPRI